MKPNAARQKAWRDKRKQEGYQMVTLWLDPDVAQALDTKLAGSAKKQADRQRLVNQVLRDHLGKQG